MAELLTVSDVTIRFGGLTALDGVSLAIEPGQIRGLIGPNGSGKTTLINVVTGVYRPNSGAVRFDGRDLLRVPGHALASLGLTRTFQNLELFGRLSVLDNLLLGQHAHLKASALAIMLRTGRARDEDRAARQRARELLELVGLERYAELRADGLAFGHQRLLEVARALATRPKLLLLDEPSAGLTTEELDELGRLLQRIRSELGTAILLVAHTMRLVMGISDRVSVLDYGVLIAEGKPTEVANDARVIEAYLGSPDAGAA